MNSHINEVLALPASALKRGWEKVKDLRGGGQSFTCIVRKADGFRGVIKVLKESDSISVERFRREVSIVEGIRHPCVVQLSDCDLDSPIPWYISPEGTPLVDHWKERRKLLSPSERFDESLLIVRGLADALTAVHSKGVVHRDIKPGNVIMLAKSPVLIDFGLAYRPVDTRLTQKDGNPVANRFAAPAEAFYGPVDEPKPAWDCLGLAWLWGWLLAEGFPKDSRYHWRFHRFIDEDRCAYVRAVLAAASVPELAPPDGAALKVLIEGLFHMAKGDSPSPDFSAAKEAVARGQALERMAEAERLERSAAEAETVVGRMDRIRRALSEVFHAAQKAGMPFQLSYGDNLTGKSTRDVLIDSARSPGERTMFLCTAGPNPAKHFFVHIRIKHYDAAEEGHFPFSLWVAFESHLGDGGRQIDHRYRFRHDGGLSWINHKDAQSRVAVVDEDHPIAQVREWLTSPINWSTASAP